MRDASRSRVVLGVLLTACVVLLVLDARGGGDPVTKGARTAGAAVFGPVSAAVTTVTGPVSDTYRAALAAPGAREEIEDLKARNSELTRQIGAQERDEGRSGELERLLNLSGLGGYEIVGANAVTHLTPQGYADTVTLDVGTRDGVRRDQTVVNGDGLVGRVVRAGTDTSTVLLLTDGASTVGARLEGSEEIGTISGASRSIAETAPLRFELLDASAKVGKGERIVTLGSHGGAPFVPGVPVGTVEKVEDTPGALSRTAQVAPVVDVSALDIVGVVVAGPKEDPRDAVLPPKPGDPKEKDGKEKAGKKQTAAEKKAAADRKKASEEDAPAEDGPAADAESDRPRDPDGSGEDR
ncbi:rod shape-determining protein MreC [Murinocardiopsis flavida]|uniref:Cell shape-determining protein MreC n=1 Tax=Murinocardiopsis flavida TaxID=645275 RepID=A0A2P8DUA7_9ACTN|nr:rod shape-determining protein MreC [Murinocardiopsis flavida]